MQTESKISLLECPESFALPSTRTKQGQTSKTSTSAVCRCLQTSAAVTFTTSGAISAAPFFWLEPCSFKEIFTGQDVKNFSQLSTGRMVSGEFLGTLSYFAFAPFAARNNWRLIKGLENPDWKDWKTYARTGALLLTIPSGTANAYNMYLFLSDPTIKVGATAQWLLITPAMLGPGIGNYVSIKELCTEWLRDTRDECRILRSFFRP